MSAVKPGASRPQERSALPRPQLLVIPNERLDDHGERKLVRLPRAGDREGQVATAWHAKEAVRALYAHTDAHLALE